MNKEKLIILNKNVEKNKIGFIYTAAIALTVFVL